MKNKLTLIIALCCLNVACTAAETPTRLKDPRIVYWTDTDSEKELEKKKKEEDIAIKKSVKTAPLHYQDALLLSNILPANNQPVHKLWRVKPGLLRAQLEDWATFAGYQVVWKVSHDYHLQSSAQFQGDIVEALNSLFTGLQQRGNTFQVTIYQGNKVILVSEE